jgi:hypothetical protein
MGYPPPAIVRRHDGLTFTGTCVCPGLLCQLVVTQEPDGSVLLSFHGTERHSFRLNPAQQAALGPLLRGGGR